MSLPARLSPRLWLLAPLFALGFLLWIHQARVERVETISAPTAPVALNSSSPTGYAGGVRMLIAPGHNNESYQWIVQTQQMIAQEEWRLRHVAYDNAPTGRPVHSPSLYRWWLAATGGAIHLATGASVGLAVEKAALWADPALQILLLVAATAFTAWRFGRLPAVLLSLGLALLFPLAGGFVPGAPDARNLTHAILLASLLSLIAGVLAAEAAFARARMWFSVAGVFGGLALWSDTEMSIVLTAVGCGGLAAAWLNRKTTVAALPWRAWSIAGAGTVVAGYLLEFAPGHLDVAAWRLTSVHPLWACAWLGAGELLVRFSARFRGEKARSARHFAAIGVAALALLSVPAVLWIKGDAAFLPQDIFANHPTLLDEATGADNFAKWMVRDGLTFELAATCLPLLLLGVAAWSLGRRTTAPSRRSALALLLVPAVVVLSRAFAELSWWNTLQFLLLPLSIAVVAGTGFTKRHATMWLAGATLALLPGLAALLPPAVKGEPFKPTQIELQSLAEREFAHWLARRQREDNAIVLAPPNLTVSLIFHGGLRGLGTPYRENDDGFRAAVRLAGAVHADEAQALARQRGVTHVVMPSWDLFLDDYARLGGAGIEQTFVGLLHSWRPPRWLRPVAYYLPTTEGFANQQLFVFEQTEVQGHALALGRLAEYFIDMGQTDLAGQVAQALAREYLGDIDAQVAMARAAMVRRDRAAFARSVEGITSGLQEGADDALVWDRRVSLCLVLAAAERTTLAKEQAERCLYDMGPAEVRLLSEATLFRFLMLTKALGLEIEDAEVRDFARSLVPAELRQQL